MYYLASVWALAQEAAPAAEETGVDLIELVMSLLFFVPEEYRGFAAIGLFALSAAGYIYVSVTASKEDDSVFMKYAGGFRKLLTLFPKKIVPPAP